MCYHRSPSESQLVGCDQITRRTRLPTDPVRILVRPLLVIAILVTGCAPGLGPAAEPSTTLDPVDALIEAIAEECGQPLDRVEEPIIFAACVIDGDFIYGAGPVGWCGLILEGLLPDRLEGIGVLVADSRTYASTVAPPYDICSVSAKKDYLIFDDSGIRGLVPTATSHFAMEEGLCYRPLPSGGLYEEVGCVEADATLLVGLAPAGGCQDLVEGLLPEPDRVGLRAYETHPLDDSSGTRVGSQDWCLIDSVQVSWQDGVVARSLAD